MDKWQHLRPHLLGESLKDFSEAALKELRETNGSGLLAATRETSPKRPAVEQRLEELLAAPFEKCDHRTINNRTRDIFEARLEIEQLTFEHIELASSASIKKYPLTNALWSTCKAPEINDEFKRLLLLRFGAAIEKVASQSRKSNAGKTGEALIAKMLESVGLTEDTHFSREDKDKKDGAATDFVFPAIPLQTKSGGASWRVAVQFSSNDRIRQATSELTGSNGKFYATFSGVDASSKGLRDIGDDNVSYMSSEGIKLVATEVAIAAECDRLEQRMRDQVDAKIDKANAEIEERKKRGLSTEAKVHLKLKQRIKKLEDERVKKHLKRLDYFKNESLTFDQFVRDAQTEFSHIKVSED